MNLPRCFALVAVLTLTGCARLTYSESPTLRDFFLKQAPGLNASAITRIDLCDVRADSTGQAETHASVLFEDNRLYLYKLDGAEQRSSLKYVTANIADVTASDMNGGLGCLRSPPGRFVIKRGMYPVGGERQLQFEVRDDVVNTRMFSDAAKGELELLAQVTLQALTAQSKLMSPRKSWGLD